MFTHRKYLEMLDDDDYEEVSMPSLLINRNERLDNILADMADAENDIRWLGETNNGDF